MSAGALAGLAASRLLAGRRRGTLDRVLQGELRRHPARCVALAALVGLVLGRALGRG